MTSSKQSAIYMGLFARYFVLIIVISLFLPDRTYLYFNDYKISDIDNIPINCQDLISFSEPQPSGSYREIDQYYYKNIHFFENDNGYKFQFCRNEIDLNLTSLCHGLHNILLNSPTHLDYAKVYYPICKKDIDKFYSEYTFGLKTSYSTLVVSQYGKDHLLLIKDFATVTKHKINFLDFWTLTIRLNNDYVYVLGFSTEAEIDNLISFLKKHDDI